MTKRTYTHWTTSSLIKAAKKFTARGAFCTGNPAAYMAAKRRGVFEKVCAHMSPKVRGIWSKEKLAAEAKRYNSRSAFAKGNKAAYSAAYRRGLVDEICSHMPVFDRCKKKVEPAQSLSEMMGLDS